MVGLKEYPFLDKSDALQLREVVEKIKRIPEVKAIVQIGSSTYSTNYNDVDVIVFFDKFLVPSDLEEIRKKYKGTKLYIEGSSIYYKDFNPGFKVFLKFFSNIKHKVFLYGKDPFESNGVNSKKTDVAAYVWYHYHICEQYNMGFEGALPNSLNAMLAYFNIFPENKEDSLKEFIKKFPSLAKYLPKNSENFLRGTTKDNFKELYIFFEQCLRYFGK